MAKKSMTIEDLAMMTKRGFDSLTDVVNSRFEQVDKRFEHLESRMDKFELRMARFEDRLSHMDARIAYIERDVAEIRKQLISRMEIEEIMFRISMVEKKLGMKVKK